MKTTHLIALTATIVACTAATASARPAVEPPGSQASKPSAATHPDPLLDCLQALTRLHGRPMSAPALAAGLPLADGQLTPDLALHELLLQATIGGGLTEEARRTYGTVADELERIVAEYLEPDSRFRDLRHE